MSPLGPKDILKLSDEEMDLKAKIVEKIDPYLKKNFMGLPVEYPIKDLEKLEKLGEIREAVLEEVMNEYRRDWTDVRIVELESRFPTKELRVKFGKNEKVGRYIRFEYDSPEEIKRREESIAEINKEYLQRSIEDSELKPGIINALKKGGIARTGELPGLTKKEVSLYKGIGQGSLERIEEKLREYGFGLKEE